MRYKNTLAISALALAAAFAAPISANVSTGSLANDVQLAAGSGSGPVNVTLKDGVATLIGNVETQTQANAAHHAAAAFPGVKTVQTYLAVLN